MGEMLAGASIVLHFTTIFLITIGVGLGIIIGILPGLGATMGVALLLPFTLTLPKPDGILLLLGIYIGAIYGGSISAILLRIPGTGGAAATTLDGYPMAQKGEAGLAIGTATISSFIGGIISIVILITAAPQIANWALKFGPPEFFALAIFGLTIIGYISGKSILNGLTAGIIGMILATVGMDPVGSVQRYTFGFIELASGIDFVSLVIGLFGLSQVFANIEKIIINSSFKNKISSNISRLIPSWGDIKKILPIILKGSFIGTFIGALPGAGASIAVWISYNEAKRSSKEPDKFGTGIIEGVAAPESANNAVTGGALIPLLTLCIPGDAVTAVILGALLMHDITPGPLLFMKNFDIVTAVFFGMVIGNIVMLILGLSFAKIFAKIVNIPPKFFIPILVSLCIVGSFSIRNSFFDVILMIFFGIIGYIFEKVGIPIPPIILGFILGQLIEYNLRLSLLLSQGSFLIFFNRPITLILLLLTVCLLTFNYINHIRKKARDSKVNSL